MDLYFINFVVKTQIKKRKGVLFLTMDSESLRLDLAELRKDIKDINKSIISFINDYHQASLGILMIKRFD